MPNADSAAVDTTCFSLSTPGAGHDRVLAVTTPERTVLAVADGVGGQSGAREAASLAVGLLSSVIRRRDAVRRPDAWVRALRGIDLLVSSSRRAGQCTVVVAEVLDGWVFGASVGDAGAMLLPAADDDRGSVDLTFAQRRKDRVGDARGQRVLSFAVRGGRDPDARWRRGMEHGLLWGRPGQPHHSYPRAAFPALAGLALLSLYILHRLPRELGRVQAHGFGALW